MSPMFCPCGGGTDNQVVTARENWEAKQQYVLQKQAKKAAEASAASSMAPASDKPGASSTIISVFGQQPAAMGSPRRRKDSNTSSGKRQVVILPDTCLSPKKIVADQRVGNYNEEHEETASSSPVTTERSVDTNSNFYDISPQKQHGNRVVVLDGKPPRPGQQQQQQQQQQEKIVTAEAGVPKLSTHRRKSAGSSSTLCASPASSTVSQENQRQQNRRKSGGGGGGFGSRNASPTLSLTNSQDGLIFGSKNSSSNSSPVSSQQRRSSAGGRGIGSIGIFGSRNPSPVAAAAGATSRTGPRLSGSSAATFPARGALRSGDHHGRKKDVRRAIISADMPGDMQQGAMDCAAHAMETHELQKDIAAYIKKEFDKMHDPTWHCITGKSFGSFVTHQGGYFVYFHIGQIAVLLFKA